jgi:hypothetical protein
MQYTDRVDKKKNPQIQDWREARRLQAWELMGFRIRGDGNTIKV